MIDCAALSRFRIDGSSPLVPARRIGSIYVNGHVSCGRFFFTYTRVLYLCLSIFLEKACFVPCRLKGFWPVPSHFPSEKRIDLKEISEFRLHTGMVIVNAPC